VRLLLRFMFVFVAIVAAMSLLRGVFAPRTPEAGGSSARRGERAGKLMKDPICGTYVGTESALTTTKRSETFYFCSEECREKFIAGSHRA